MIAPMRSFPSLLVLFGTACFSVSGALAQPAQPTAQPGLSGWPCFGHAARSYRADYKARVGSPVSFAARARCTADNGRSAAAIEGTLPPGLNLRGTNLVGVPETPGDFYFSVKYPEGGNGRYELATFHVRIDGSSAQ